MASALDDLPLILGFTVVAFVLGAMTPVVVHRLDPTPQQPAPQTQDLHPLRDAVGALDRTVDDLSKTVSSLAAEVNKLRVELAAARRPPEPQPPSVSQPASPSAPQPEPSPASPGPSAGDSSDSPPDAQRAPSEP